MSGRSRLDDLVASYAVPEATAVEIEAPDTEAVVIIVSDDDEEQEQTSKMIDFVSYLSQNIISRF